MSNERAEWLILNDRIYWWKPNHCGYSVDILDAGLYTEAQARRIENIRPPHDQAVHISARADELKALQARVLRLTEVLSVYELREALTGLIVAGDRGDQPVARGGARR